MAQWLYQNQPFTDAGDYYGMVYMITNMLTGKRYLGRKYFTKAKIQQKTKTKRKKKLRVTSNWETYYGSNAELLEDVKQHGPDWFRREILHLCTTRGETNYYEVHEIFAHGALLSDQYYNKWVSLKLHKSTLSHLQSQSSAGANSSVAS